MKNRRNWRNVLTERIKNNWQCLQTKVFPVFALVFWVPSRNVHFLLWILFQVSLETTLRIWTVLISQRWHRLVREQSIWAHTDLSRRTMYCSLPEAFAWPHRVWNDPVNWLYWISTNMKSAAWSTISHPSVVWYSFMLWARALNTCATKLEWNQMAWVNAKIILNMHWSLQLYCSQNSLLRFIWHFTGYFSSPFSNEPAEKRITIHFESMNYYPESVIKSIFSPSVLENISRSEADTLLKQVTRAVMALASGNGKSWFRWLFSSNTIAIRISFWFNIRIVLIIHLKI